MFRNKNFMSKKRKSDRLHDEKNNEKNNFTLIKVEILNLQIIILFENERNHETKWREIVAMHLLAQGSLCRTPSKTS